jgi:hypothetical protein
VRPFGPAEHHTLERLERGVERPTGRIVPVNWLAFSNHRLDDFPLGKFVSLTDRLN